MKLNLKKSPFLNLLLALIILLSCLSISAQSLFVRLYGDNQENSFSKVIPTGQGYYALGSQAGVATISYVNLTGQHQWTRLLNMPSVLTDAVRMTSSSNLLFVGYTLPLNSANQSIIGTVDPFGFVSSVIAYDTPGQEGLTKVVANPPPGGGYSVLGYHSPNGPEEVVLLTLDANAVITAKDRLTGTDSDFTNDLDNFGNDFLITGSFGNTGVIYQMNSAGQFVNGVMETDPYVFQDVSTTCGTLAGLNSTTVAHPRLVSFDANLLPLWDVEVQGLESIHQIVPICTGGFFYVVGTTTVNNISRTIVILMESFPASSPPTWHWARYITYNETAYTRGSIALSLQGRIAYVDGRSNNPNGFALDDAFMAVTFGFNTSCTDSISINLMNHTALWNGPPGIDFTLYDIPPGLDLLDMDLPWQQSGGCSLITPIISCGDIKAFVEPEYTDARVDFDKELALTDFASLEYDPPSGSVFSLGITPVTATAIDINGNSTSCAFEVEVAHLPSDSLQPPLLASPEGWFDRVRDQYGNPYRLADLQVPDPLGGNLLCSNSGYFDLYFDVGCGMEGNSAAEVARRNVICQLFSDVSQFITPVNAATKVKIWIRDLSQVSGVPNPATSGLLGLAGAFYTMPAGAPAKGGIADSEIWKTINSGVDSYTGFTSPLTTQIGGGFYHGFVAFNFVNPGIDWHTDLVTSTSASRYDLYTVALHELVHALGFASLIVPGNNTGASFFAPAFPRYFSRYDSFLESPAGQGNLPLITNAGACSPMYDYDFNPALANTGVLAPNPFSLACNPDHTVCADAIQFVSSTVNQAVFTPNCYYGGSSLSHFEDECHVPTPQANNQYYVMSNMNGPGAGYMKRYLKPEEREVLCQLGYEVAGQYGNVPQLTHYDYQTGNCPGLGVAGVNDGIGPNGNFLYTAAVNGTTAAIFPLLNDHGAVSYECLERVSGTGTPSNTSGTSFTYQASASSGIELLRYVPVGAGGERGNITYILIYIEEAGCMTNVCNMVSNGGFESGTGCGGFYPQNLASNAPQVDCWASLAASPDLFTRNCAISFAYQLNVGTFNSIPATDSHNGAPNDKVLGLYRASGFPQSFSEAVQARLSSPLVPGQTYILSFWGKTNNNINGPASNLPAQVEFASDGVFPLAHLLKYLPGTAFQPLFPDITVPNDNQWHFFSQTFTFNGPVPHANLIVAYGGLTLPPGLSGTYVFLDDIKLIGYPTALNFSPPSPVCLVDPTVGLNSTVSIPGGVFSGTGVSVSGGNYSFDPAVAGLGTHPITYTYTDVNGCEITATDSIQVINCVPCTCGTFSDLNWRPAQGAPNMPIACGDDLTLTCPGADVHFYGDFNCQGDNCPPALVNWVLRESVTQNLVGAGTVSASAGFDIALPAAFFAQPGVYELFLVGECNGNLCEPCMFTITSLECPCSCGTFSDLFIRGPQGAQSQPLMCGGPPLNIGCPAPGLGYTLTGNFQCAGTDCPPNTDIDWTLEAPDGGQAAVGTIQSPWFALTLASNYFTQTGIYTLTLTGHCGTQTCPCILQFLVEEGCPDPCPCDLEELQANVNQGFASALWSTSCQACFSPLALDDCDEVEWLVDDLLGTPVGTSTGNQSFCYTFPNAGTYTIYMRATRLQADGSLCESFTKAQMVQVSCLFRPDCASSVFPNPRFSEGAVAGTWDAGGASSAWEPLIGTPEVLEGEPGSYDGWTIQLAGNIDATDVLTQLEAVCITKDTGTLTVQLRLVPWGDPHIPENDGKKWDFKARLFQGDGFDPFDCPEDNCWQLASIDLSPYDTGWVNLAIPYDLRDWNASSVCGGLLVRPAIYLTNPFNNDQGGEATQARLQMDNFCLDGLLVGTDDSDLVHGIHLFPNPTSGELHLQFTSGVPKAAQVQILDLWGRVLYRETLATGSMEYDWPGDGIPGGIYFVRVLSEGRSVWIEKLVKQ